MAKKTAKKKPTKKTAEPGAFEKLGQRVDEMPQVRAAQEAVQRAREELDKSMAKYQNVRDEAADKIKGLGETGLGDLVDESLAYVRRHPGRGVVAAVVAGFFLGKLFRR
jgi:ElaB/YqjD/DUF883 family membrane-anchored ribosome-binding protein